MGTLISAAALNAQIADDNLRVFDCRFSLADPTLGRKQFTEGHIPGAQYADLNLDLSAPVTPGKTGRHPLPTPESFAARLGHYGLENQHRVVTYDDGSGAYAARMWWMLRWIGHQSVTVLDGGLRAWQAAGYTTTTETRSPAPTRFAQGPSLTRVAEASELPTAYATVIDARDESRFRGIAEPIDPVAGHIPGAICSPFTRNLGPDQCMKDGTTLRKQFEQAGASPNRPVICYCGSGVTAAQNILALVHAGYAEPALYPGSWSEWITDPARPIERDPVT